MMDNVLSQLLMQRVLSIKSACLSDSWASSEVEKRLWAPHLSALSKDGAGAVCGGAGLQELSLCKSGSASSEVFGVEQDRTHVLSAFIRQRNLPLRCVLNTNHISPQGSSAHRVQVPRRRSRPLPALLPKGQW